MMYIVGVSEMKVVEGRKGLILTPSLGSCIGVTAFAPYNGVGGMIHIAMPSSGMDPDRARSNPCAFIDTGMADFIGLCVEMGAKRSQLVVAAAGGASFEDENGEDYFKIGKRNIVMLRRYLWQNDMILANSDLGGTLSRKMTLDLGSGEVVVASLPGYSRVLVRPLPAVAVK